MEQESIKLLEISEKINSLFQLYSQSPYLANERETHLKCKRNALKRFSVLNKPRQLIAIVRINKLSL